MTSWDVCDFTFNTLFCRVASHQHVDLVAKCRLLLALSLARVGRSRWLVNRPERRILGPRDREIRALEGGVRAFPKLLTGRACPPPCCFSTSAWICRRHT